MTVLTADRPETRVPPTTPSANDPRPKPLPDFSEIEQDLLSYRPLRRLDTDEFEEFLYRSRMYPTFSRFAPGSAEFLTPRRDISVGTAIASLRQRMQHALAVAEMAARLERALLDGDSRLDDDDEAILAAASIRDTLREALGMLGVLEQAFGDGRAVLKTLVTTQ
ncbi:hypothetical protein [Roseateles chitosanitabidus]|uniref:hypothetical protein n=1 Tax=Roseateles chitosanitabidus TaxID=65048 RepID=UPI00082DA409|nr:hypothetical protein [Roseateles chitosanitabidus]MBO9685183.1 hypothetical protein [Roseateles chitosanitabidus]